MRDAGSEAEETEGEGGGWGMDLKEGSGEIKPERGDVGGQPAVAVTPVVQLGARPPPTPVPSPECGCSRDRPASGPVGNHSLQTNEV